jgi:hypothetical protein
VEYAHTSNLSSEDIIALYEKYILETDKENFFKSLVKNSDTYYFMKLYDNLNRYGLDLPKETIEDLHKYLIQGTGPNKLKVALKHWFIQFEQETDEQKKSEMLIDFNNKYLHE